MFLPRLWKRLGWQNWHAVTLVLLVIAAFAVTLDAWGDMLRLTLRDQESSHGLLVPVVVGWLLWVRRRRLRHCRPRPSWVGTALVVCGALCYTVGDAYMLQSVWHGGAILVAVGCLITVIGPDYLVQLAPAFVVLGFLIPVPGVVRQQVAIPLQSVTAAVAQRMFDVIGVDVLRVGNTLSINGVDVQIVEACNGLRMVFALALVSFAFAFGNPLRPHVRALVLVATPISAVTCNVIRLVPTVWIYGSYSKTVAEHFHDIGAWVMLVVSFLILLAIVRALRWALVPVSRFTLAYD